MTERRIPMDVSVTIVISACLLFGSIAQGYSGIEHAVLGVKSWTQCHLWQDFDSSFQNELSKTTNPVRPEHHEQWMVRKFYLLGCMLPDLFTPEGDTAARWILRTLYGQSGIPEGCPLYITQATYDLAAPGNKITWSQARPNDNLPALRAMVVYAKQQGWTPWEKALIYGAYAHVVMDLHAGCFQEPSLWGKDFVLEPEDARLPEDVDILSDVEMHNNFFQPTYISQNDWTVMMSFLYSASKLYNDSTTIEMPGDVQFFRQFHSSQPYGLRSWQDTLFVPEQKFVDAVQATNYQVQNLTPERLHAYLHGYGIVWFLIAGYPRGHSEEAGGIYSHPDWDFYDISDYFLSIGAENLSGYGWLLGDLAEPVINILKLILFPRGQGGLFMPDWLRIWFPDLQLEHGWTWYLQEASNLQNWYDVVPESLKGRIQSSYDYMSDYIAQWSQTSKAPLSDKPNVRSAYRNEPAIAESLMPEMRKNVTLGPSYLSHSVRTLARKAGLVGGMWGNGDVVYRQPGIVDLEFKKDGALCYSTLDVPTSGDSNPAQLCYDVLPFAPQVRFQVIGKTDEQDPGQQYGFETEDNSEYVRVQGAVSLNLTRMVAQGVTRVSYILSNYPPYQVMLNSDYEETYASDSRISGNLLYHDWLKAGIVTRDPGEDPIGDPKHFWPYVLQLNPIQGYYLSAPTALTCTLSRSGPLAAELNWADNSSYEYGYKIEKTVNHSSPTYIGLLPANTTHYEDANVAFGDTYRYRVWCERDQWKSDTTPYAQIVIAVSSESIPPTAYNNQCKVVARGNDVHMTYYSNSEGGVMYVHSSDGGRTWGLPELVQYGALPTDRESPAIALDNAGNPYVLWSGSWRGGQQGIPWSLPYFVSSRSASGQWNVDSSPAMAFAFGDSNLNHVSSPSLAPPPASFSIRDSWGLAVLNYAGNDSVSPRYPGTYFAQFLLKAHFRQGVGVLESIAPYSNASNPTMLVDAAGRKVVISAYAGIDDDSVMRISYMDPNQSSFSYQDQHNGHVCNLTGALEDGANVLLAWVNGGDSLQFGRFVKGNSGYTPAPGVEMVSDVNIDYDYTRPKFVANYLGLPMLVYEYGPTWRGGIWYAMRQKPGCWSGDSVFTSACYVSYPQGFCAGSRLRVFASGSDACYWPPYYLLSGSVMLPWYQFPSTSNAHATWPNSGRKLVVEPDGEGVHVVYDAGDSVLYAVSRDGGETWAAPSKIDRGNYPSIALDAAGLPTIVYERNDTVFCKMRRADSTWKAMALYCGSATLPPGPPAAGRSLNSTAGYSYCAFPAYDLSRTRKSKVCLVKIDTTLGGQTQYVGETTAVSIDSFVSIACSPDGPISVAWQRIDRVICATFSGGVPPRMEQVSSRPSSHPFVEAYGDRVYLVWRDLQSGCIYMTSRQVGGIWDVVGIGADSADYPVYPKGLALAYARPDTNAVDDIWAQVPGFVHDLSESPNVSSENPHLDVEIDSTQVADTVYSIWTESVGQSLYAVRFRKLGVQRQTMEGVMALTKPLPLEPMLFNAAPCPSRGRTVLRYQVPRPERVTLRIYDATGRAVRTVLDSKRPAGVYTLTWDGRDQRGRVSPNGIYFCTMKAGDYRSGKKLIMTR